MALIDIDALRGYLLDYCDTAMFSGFPACCSTRMYGSITSMVSVPVSPPLRRSSPEV